MSSVTVNESIFCGFLGLESKENSGVFSRKFFRLDPKACILQYYSEGKSKQGTETQPEGSFNISYMSMAADACSNRPKLPHVFYIVVCGEKHFFQAATDCEKSTWIEKLLDASRITVQQRKSFIEQSSDSGFRVQVVGGVVVKTPMEHEKADGPNVIENASTLKPTLPFDHDENTIKTGYCVKQGVFDKTPLKNIAVVDIKDARRSVGIHLNRENVFEIVTSPRVFYIQASSVSDMDSWISAISQSKSKFMNQKVQMNGLTKSYILTSGSGKFYVAQLNEEPVLSWIHHPPSSRR